jgi:hypothetical protein
MGKKGIVPITSRPPIKGKDPLIAYETGLFSRHRFVIVPREVLDAPPPKSRWRRILNYLRYGAATPTG